MTMCSGKVPQKLEGVDFFPIHLPIVSGILKAILQINHPNPQCSNPSPSSFQYTAKVRYPAVPSVNDKNFLM